MIEWTLEGTRTPNFRTKKNGIFEISTTRGSRQVIVVFSEKFSIFDP